MTGRHEDLLFWLRRAAARSEGPDRDRLLAASECIEANRILADIPDDFLFESPSGQAESGPAETGAKIPRP